MSSASRRSSVASVRASSADPRASARRPHSRRYRSRWRQRLAWDCSCSGAASVRWAAAASNWPVRNFPSARSSRACASASPVPSARASSRARQLKSSACWSSPNPRNTHALKLAGRPLKRFAPWRSISASHASVACSAALALPNVARAWTVVMCAVMVTICRSGVCNPRVA